MSVTIESTPVEQVAPATEASPDVAKEAAPAEKVEEPSAPAAEPHAEPTSDSEKPTGNRRSNFFSKLVPFKGKKTAKKEKKEVNAASSSDEATEHPSASAPAPAAVEAVPEPAADPVPIPVPVESEVAQKAEVHDKVPEASKAAEVSKTPEDARTKATKVGRRLSARVGLFFKAKAREEVQPQRVDEVPPKIEETVSVEPLVNPSQQEAPAPGESSEAAPTAPVVAAAA